MVRDVDLFTDAFPEAQSLDLDNLAANWCRMDVGIYKSGSHVLGDSLVFSAIPARNGAEMVGSPLLNWVLQCNPLFDPVRPETPDAQGYLRGRVASGLVQNINGQPILGKWAVDLPDTGWFFPGDVLHYYITATSDFGGDIRTSVWPADTTSVLNFTPESLYPNVTVTRALPTLYEDNSGTITQPSILLVDNTGGQEEHHVWTNTLSNTNRLSGIDFDTITLFPGVLGLNPIADLENLEGYQTIIYTSGTHKNYMFYEDYGYYNDVTVLSDWMNIGGKQALFAGSDLWYGITNTTGGNLLRDNFGVELIDADISEVNGNQLDLQVTSLNDNRVLPNWRTWVLNSGCPSIVPCNALNASIYSEVAATLDPVGAGNGIYAAVIATRDLTIGNRSVATSFDLGMLSGPTAQGDFLGHILAWLNSETTAVKDTPSIEKVAASAHPNPFNPTTTIAFELPQNLKVSLDIFDIQGRLIRNLFDEMPHLTGSHSQVWDGRDSEGQNTASGVYFYRLKAGQDKLVGKLTLLK